MIFSLLYGFDEYEYRQQNINVSVERQRCSYYTSRNTITYGDKFEAKIMASFRRLHAYVVMIIISRGHPICKNGVRSARERTFLWVRRLMMTRETHWIRHRCYCSFRGGRRRRLLIYCLVRADWNRFQWYYLYTTTPHSASDGWEIMIVKKKK